MRIVIVGAGISGLSLAAFLRRLNVECIVLEQAPFLRAQYVPPYVLYANALSCYKAHGLDFIFESGGSTPEEFFGVKDERGAWLLRIRNRQLKLRPLNASDAIPLSTAPTANSNSIVSRRVAENTRYEMGCVPLRWTAPAVYLRESLRRNIPEIKFGSRVVDLLPHDGIKGGVQVVLEDGSTEWGDVVVGADGLHSTVRKLLYPEEHIGVCSKSLGMLHIDGFVESRQCPPNLEYPVELWGHRQTLRSTPMYRFGEDAICFTATMYDQPNALITSAEMDGLAVREMLRTRLTHNFKSFSEDIVHLLGTAVLALPHEALEVPVMPRWYNRRAVLIGDAAHGSLPSFLNQDASLCVEDAALLATSLLDVPLHRDSGYEYTFRQYETVRRERVERYIRHSRRARRFTATSHSTLRNGLLRLVPPACVNLSQKWLSSWSYSAQLLEIDPKTKMETAFR